MSSLINCASISGRATSTILISIRRPGQFLKVFLKDFDLGPLAADDHARPRGREQHGHGIAGALDLDLGNAREAVFLLDEGADLEILDQQVGEFVLGSVPAAPPVFHDPHTKPGRSNFLAHDSLVHRFPRAVLIQPP